VIPTLSRGSQAGHFSKLKKLLSIYLPQQTYSNYEALVVCDGPNKEVEDMVESLNDDRVKAFETREYTGKWGHPQTRLGIRKARGEYFVRLNDDNKPYPRYLESLKNGFSENIDVVYCRVVFKGEARETHKVNFEGEYRDGVRNDYEYIMPRDREGTLAKCNIDCMNYMVRICHAKQHVDSWTDSYTADWSFLESILEEEPEVKFIDQVLGEKR